MELSVSFSIFCSPSFFPSTCRKYLVSIELTACFEVNARRVTMATFLTQPAFRHLFSRSYVGGEFSNEKKKSLASLLLRGLKRNEELWKKHALIDVNK